MQVYGTSEQVLEAVAREITRHQSVLMLTP